MRFAKMITALLVTLLVGFAVGQQPAAPKETTKLDRLHDQRIEVYSELLELAHARGSRGREQQKKLILVKLDAAKTPVDRVVLAKELLELCRQNERTVQATTPDDTETMLKAKSERIEAEILVEQLAATE